MRDLIYADAELVERIQGYLGVDRDVLQIALGRLNTADSEVNAPHRPCDDIRGNAEARLATDYAMALRQLSAEFAYPQMTQALADFPSLGLVNCEESTREWEALESELSRGNALLHWVAHTGNTLSCTPCGMCKHLRRLPCWVHLMFGGGWPIAHLPSPDLGRFAHF